jgi:hypothetical protein
MPANPVFPGSPNVYVPSHEASGKLVVDFSRNPKKFAINQYTQIFPVDKVLGLYQTMTVEERGRLPSTNLAEFEWADGNDAPTGLDGTESFVWNQYLAKRRAFAFRLGDMTVDQASWEIIAQHAAIKAQQAMTARTQLVYNALTTSGNYATGQVVAAASIPGASGNWAQSTTARSDIRRSLTYAFETMLDSTLGALEPQDCHLVIGSGAAKAIAQTQEIIDYVKGSPDAMPHLRQEPSSNYAMYGLPDTLYGFKVVVDKTRKTTSQKGATAARSSVFASGNAFLIARPGELVNEAGGPSFSFLGQFVYNEYDMAVETKYDDHNKRTVGRVIDAVDVRGVAPQAGFWFQSIT